MYLILPKSIIIPDVMDRCDDNNFEDWVTASVIENTNQPDENDDNSPSSGFTDLWMLQITKRDGRIWSGNFRVEFSTEEGPGSQNATTSEDGTRELSFFLDTDTGEMRFNSEPRKKSPVSLN